MGLSVVSCQLSAVNGRRSGGPAITAHLAELVAHFGILGNWQVMRSFDIDRLKEIERPASRFVIPGADSALPRRLRNRLGGRVAEGEQDVFRAFRLVAV